MPHSGCDVHVYEHDAATAHYARPSKVDPRLKNVSRVIARAAVDLPLDVQKQPRESRKCLHTVAAIERWKSG
jgi:anti-sigma factor RsiW